MNVIVICGVLVLVGLAMAVKWSGLDVVQPPGPGTESSGRCLPTADSPITDPPTAGPITDPPTADSSTGSPPAAGPITAGLAIRRLAWRLNVAITAGLVAGITVAGAGGRLAMRLLAATAGDAAQGRLTEAEQAVGRITADGTIGFIIFVGLFSGLVTGLLFLVLHRWLPRGRLSGLAFGGLLLIVGATRFEPLRADNPDFDLVGPSWVALLVFTAVVVVHGLVTAAVAGRLSRCLPLISRRPRAVLAYLPLVIILFPSPLLGGSLALAVLAVVLTRSSAVAQAVASRWTLVGGRILLAGIVLASLPGFFAALVDIAGRGT